MRLWFCRRSLETGDNLPEGVSVPGGTVCLQGPSLGRVVPVTWGQVPWECSSCGNTAPQQSQQSVSQKCGWSAFTSSIFGVTLEHANQTRRVIAFYSVVQLTKTPNWWLTCRSSIVWKQWRIGWFVWRCFALWSLCFSSRRLQQGANTLFGCFAGSPFCFSLLISHATKILGKSYTQNWEHS